MELIEVRSRSEQSRSPPKQRAGRPTLKRRLVELDSISSLLLQQQNNIVFSFPEEDVFVLYLLHKVYPMLTLCRKLSR
jgi:hypothetical protein